MQYRLDRTLQHTPGFGHHLDIEEWDDVLDIYRSVVATVRVKSEEINDDGSVKPYVMERAVAITAALNTSALLMERSSEPAIPAPAVRDEEIRNLMEDDYWQSQQEYHDEVDDYREHCWPFV